MADTLLVITQKKGVENDSCGDKHRCVPVHFFDVMVTIWCDVGGVSKSGDGLKTYKIEFPPSPIRESENPICMS
jgi:hypothetical protein